MVEREKGGEAGVEKKELIGKLMGMPNIKQQLKRQGVSWLAKPPIAPAADLVFVGTREGEADGLAMAGKLKSITFFLAGVELHAAAVIFLDDDEDLFERKLKVKEQLNAVGQLHGGVVIHTLGRSQVENWLRNQAVIHGKPVVAEKVGEEKETASEEKLILMEQGLTLLFGEGGYLEEMCDFVDGRKVTPGLDVFFVPKEGQDSDSPVVPLNLYGGAFGGAGVEEAVPIGSVVGLKFFEEGTPAKERAVILRKVQSSVRTWFSNRQFQVLGVTRKTLEMWLRKGRALVTEEDVQEFLGGSDPVTQVDHGFYIPSQTGGEVSLRIYEPGRSMIGGTQMFFTNKVGGLRQTVLMDFGWPFGRSKYLSSVMGRPAYKDGLLPYLRHGIIPDVPRLLRQDLLDVSLSPELFNTENPWGMFILRELYHRHGLIDLKEMTKKSLPVFEANSVNWRRWDQVLPRWREQEYLEKEIFHAMLITHGHQDHATGGSFVRFEIPAGMSRKTNLILEVDFTAGWHWTVQEVIKRKMRERRGLPLPVEERSVIVFDDGETVELGGGMRATGYEVYHSMLGAMGYLVESVNALGQVTASVGYPGDYRFDTSFFEAVGKRGVHTLFVEGTNLPGTKKSSAAVTEADVKANLAVELRGSNVDRELVIVRAVKGNEERLQNIVEIAGDRQVLVSRRVAKMLHLASIWEQQGADEAEVVRILSGETNLSSSMLGSGQVLIHQGHKERYAPWERELMQMYGSVTDEEVSAWPRKYLLILDHRDKISSLRIGGQGVGVKFIDSVYWAYEEDAKNEIKHVMDECRQRGWKYLSDFRWASGGLRPAQGRFHASGHVDFEHQVELIRLAKPERIIIGHTLARGKMAEALRDALPGVEVVEAMNHPWGVVEF